MQHDHKAVQVFLRAEEHRALKTIAAVTSRSITEIVSAKVREAIAENRPRFLDAQPAPRG